MLDSTPLIVVADDDPLLIQVVEPLLGQDGYRIRVATNGMSLLAIIQIELPDLILLDAVMPEPDGFECCQRIRTLPEASDLPILMITYLEDNESIDRGFEVGVTDFIPKPLHWGLLRQRIRRLLKIRQDRQQILKLNAELDYQVSVRNAELREAIDYEQLLRVITDEVRSTLKEEDILSTAVRELTQGLKLGFCKVGIPNDDGKTYHVPYESVGYLSPFESGPELLLNQEILPQLLQGKTVLYSRIEVYPRAITVLSCPLLDGNQFLGFLSLIRSPEESFNMLEVRLAEQVAIQCVIGIRQSRFSQSLQQKVTQLSELNQLKDDFVNLVSHELRTPLTNMKMALQMMGTLPQTEKQARYLEILENEWKRELELVNDLLDLQALESGMHRLEKQSIPLTEWMLQLLDPFWIRCQDHHQNLSVELPDPLPIIQTDPKLLSRILAELLNNACKYTPPQEKIILSATLSASTLEIQVANTGVEIPAEKLPHIFDKFFRVPQLDAFKQGGTGLGLALAKKAAEHLNGTITATSQQRSTRFSLRLKV